MRKVLVFSLLLLSGLIGSQLLPDLPGYGNLTTPIRFLTMAGLAFIMIRVGYEFDIDKTRLSEYRWDYVVAFTAATFPWILVTGYFVFVLLPSGFWSDVDAWKETLLAGRFAAPTSAGVLFSMLAAAGLGATWLFAKARVLAIFDDLDTVLLMIPLKMLIVGVAWQLGIIVAVMVALLFVAYRYLHLLRIPATWKWVLGYAVTIAAASELIYAWSKLIDESVPIHFEVLLPAFVLGCLLAYPSGDAKAAHALVERSQEQKASTAVAAAFMVLVGLSMPLISLGGSEPATVGEERSLEAAGSPDAERTARDIGAEEQIGTVTASQPSLGAGAIALHVLAITILSNLGKMFPALCYRREAHWRTRVALAIGMWPRGEVGAGVLVISLSYGIGGPIVTVALLSLALNLLLTGVFILAVRRLVNSVDAREWSAEVAPHQLTPVGKTP